VSRGEYRNALFLQLYNATLPNAAAGAGDVLLTQSKDIERTVGINCRYLGALQYSDLTQRDRTFLVEVSNAVLMCLTASACLTVPAIKSST